MYSLKTKVFTCFLSFVMAFSLLPALNSNAATARTWSDKNPGITCKLTDDGTFTISGKGAMYDYTLYTNSKTDAPWSDYRHNIKKIVVGNGITRIGNNAFANSYQLASIEFKGTTLESIGMQAFYSCNALKSVDLPAGLTKVGKSAFYCCSKLEAVTIPNTVKVIAVQAFCRCNLKKVYLPASVTTIGDQAFRSNYNLVKVYGGAGLQTIGVWAFAHCSKLNYFAITSKKLKKISQGTFVCCSKLKTVYIKNTTKLTKKGVKGSMYLSSVKTVKVKKSKVKKYKKYFTRRNSGKSVKVKK